MSPPEAYSWAAPSGPGGFQTTHWTTVLQAGESRSPDAAQALEKLCRAYWYPLYAFVRRQGHDVHAAQDLTQGFFARLLEKKYLRDVDPHKGRFRSFLLASLKHFLANERDKARAQKRGGGAPLFSLGEKSAEDRYQLEPLEETTPESVFEKRWAQTVLERVFARLQEEFSEAGKQERYDLLKPYLLEEPGADAYAIVAARLGLSESAVSSAVQRLRQRFAQLFRTEIAHTVASTDEIDGEIRHLFEVLGR